MLSTKRMTSLLLLLLLPIISSATYEQNNNHKDDWILSEQSESSLEFREKIESAVNDFFNDDIYQKLADAIGSRLSKEIGNHLGELISFGPLIKFNDIISIGSGGASESEVMLRIILEAIKEAKEEIINAIDRSFQDETQAILNSVIDELEEYFARSELTRNIAYNELPRIMGNAILVMNRIEQRTERHLQNSHYYMAMAALQIEAQKEYTWRAAMNLHPDTNEEAIQQEFRNIAALRIASANNFISMNSNIGTVSFWRENFDSEFDASTIRFVSNLSADDPLYSNSYSDLSGIYSYSMGGKPVEFKLVITKCSAARVRSMEGLIYDAAGVYVGNFRQSTSCSVNNILSRLPNSDSLKQAVENHRSSDRAFLSYVQSGYGPIRDILDGWWGTLYDTSRPPNEIETFIDAFNY